MRSWITTNVGSLATYINGRGFKPVEWTAQGYPIIRIANLNDPLANYDYFSGDLDDGPKSTQEILLFLGQQHWMHLFGIEVQQL